MIILGRVALLGIVLHSRKKDIFIHVIFDTARIFFRAVVYSRALNIEVLKIRATPCVARAV